MLTVKAVKHDGRIDCFCVDQTTDNVNVVTIERHGIENKSGKSYQIDLYFAKPPEGHLGDYREIFVENDAGKTVHRYFDKRNTRRDVSG